MIVIKLKSLEFLTFTRLENAPSLEALEDPMQKTTKDLDWDKIKTKIEETDLDEQKAWTDTEGEDGGVERQEKEE